MAVACRGHQSKGRRCCCVPLGVLPPSCMRAHTRRHAQRKQIARARQHNVTAALALPLHVVRQRLLLIVQHLADGGGGRAAGAMRERKGQRAHRVTQGAQGHTGSHGAHRVTQGHTGSASAHHVDGLEVDAAGERVQPAADERHCLAQATTGQVAQHAAHQGL